MPTRHIAFRLGLTDSGLYPIDETEYDKTDTTTDGWALDDSNVVWSDPITYTVPVTVGKVKNLKIKQISKDDNWYRSHGMMLRERSDITTSSWIKKHTKVLKISLRRLVVFPAVLTASRFNSRKVLTHSGSRLSARIQRMMLLFRPKIKVKSQTAQQVHPSMDWKVVFYKKTPLYKSRSGYAKIKTIKKKTKGAIALDWSPPHISDWGTPSRIQVKLKNGKKGWVPYSYVDIVADNTWKKSYAKSAILKYVNQFGSANK